VVSGADQIAVTLPDGREMAGVVMGSDPRADLAVIKIDGQDFPVAMLGDSTELKPGQWVVALGNPFGYVLDDPTPSVTTGVVSALHRSLPGTSRNYTGLIQTDAAINPGNSGGPLVNLEGHVIGINVAIFSPSGGSIGLGFAIPVNRAKTIVETLIKGERVKYGWLGVEIQDLTPEVAAFYRLEHVAGVMVYNVVGGSPAAMAGMKDGDIIQSYAGRRVKNTRELMNIVGETSVGAKIKMSVVRGGAVRTIVVTIGERGGTAIAHTSDMHGAWRGLQVAEISAAVRQQYHVSDAVVGVVVVEVVPESPAARARMRVGDIINRVNERRIHDVETFVSAARGLRGNVLLRTVRGFVVIPPQ
jgi:serine protease Do